MLLLLPLLLGVSSALVDEEVVAVSRQDAEVVEVGRQERQLLTNPQHLTRKQLVASQGRRLRVMRRRKQRRLDGLAPTSEPLQWETETNIVSPRRRKVKKVRVRKKKVANEEDEEDEEEEKEEMSRS